jgi:alpha-beta hydrolase superfamily lysophospholipase
LTVRSAGRAGCTIASLTAVLAATAVAQSPKETVSPLPKPTGALAVGTTVAYLTDSSRKDAEFSTGRPINVQLWYPAAAAAGATAGYLADSGLLASYLRNQYYGVDSAALLAWGKLPTHSHLDTPPLGGTHPLVAFSVGLGVARANYTSIAEELASYGYIVALVESPLQGFMVRPDHREVLDTIGRFGEAPAHRQGVASWSKDISFVLDQLRARRVPSASVRIASTVDWSRVGAFGHSSGGLVAIAACERDSRVRVCVDMDGGMAAPDKQPLADFVTRGVSKPTLLLRAQPLYDDTTFARRGTTREKWEKQAESGRIALDEFAARSGANLRVAHVAGAGHFSFTDAPFVMPTALTRFGGRIIRAERGWTLITTVLRTYFDAEFRGAGDGLDALTARFPELTVDRPK